MANFSLELWPLRTEAILPEVVVHGSVPQILIKFSPSQNEFPNSELICTGFDDPESVMAVLEWIIGGIKNGTEITEAAHDD